MLPCNRTDPPPTLDAATAHAAVEKLSTPRMAVCDQTFTSTENHAWPPPFPLQLWAFFTYEHIPGSPWNIKNPADCASRWAENHPCSKRGLINTLPPLPKSPEYHIFSVRFCLT